MYNYSNYPVTTTQYVQNGQGDRLIGGFAFPFLLGGVTGAAIAPAFWGPRPYPPNYGPVPGYGPGFGPGPYYR